MAEQAEEEKISIASAEDGKFVIDFYSSLVAAAVKTAVTVALDKGGCEAAELAARGASEGIKPVFGAIRRPKAFRGLCTKCKKRGHFAGNCTMMKDGQEK